MITCEWLDGDRQAMRITVSGRMTIAHAADCYQAVRDAFADAARVIYDLNGVEEVDAAGMQLLFSSQQTAASEGKVLQIDGLEREPFLTALKSAGSLHHFSCQPD